MKITKSLVFAVAVAALTTASAFSFAQSMSSADKPPEILVPDNFRTSFEFLGAWAVANDADSSDADSGSAVGQHIVYASPGNIAAYRQSGQFPDGTVLVKELFNGKTEDLTTGTATSAAEVTGYFVMVKDAEGRYEGPLWGDGWGWAFFNPDDPKTTVTTDYEAECLACHEPVRDRDLVYSYAYPVLQR